MSRNRGDSVSGKIIWNLKYDDTTLVLVDEQEFAELINRVKVVSKELELRINTSKTKVMVIDRAGCLPRV